MQLFYLKDRKNELILSAEESKHTTKVLRKRKGDVLNFTDGNGSFYKAKITRADSKRCRLKVISHHQKKKQHDYYLHMAIAPTKSMDRFEFFLEKATEIGVDEITPLICSYSERKIIKTERANRILQSAMKQSLKYHLPKLNDVVSFNDFINKEFNGAKYIAHCTNSKKLDLKSINKVGRTLILIGPEGDFSPKEIELALEKKFKAVSLSNSRLRTETAGIISVQIINMMY